MLYRFVPAAIGTLFAASSAFAQAQPGQHVDAAMTSGDVVRGVVISEDDTNLVLQHPVLGKLTIARRDLASVTVLPEAAPPPPPPPPPAPETPPDPDSFWKGWTGSLEFGLNGAEGNSSSLSVRGAATFKRDTSKTTTLFGVLYTYGSSNHDKDLDRGEVDIRNDWKTGTPWRIYVTGKAEYDAFQEWDWRLSTHAGVGYEVIKTDNTLLLPRIGVGISKEFGSHDGDIEPELDIGLDWEHKLDERQKLFATVDYYPSLDRFTTYRAEAKAGYEIIVDPTNKLALKLGVDERYQSNPGDDKKKSDFLYFATIVYTF
jgi:putative salt-induced outer membrane protein YdiY